MSRSLYKGGRGESPFFSLHAVPPFPFNARRRLLGHRLSRPPPTAIGSLPALLRPRRPLVAVRRARSASPPTSSPSRRALRRRRLGPFASAPLASSAAAIHAPRVFCLPSSTVQARPCSRRDRESAREQGSTPRARATQSLPSHAVSTRGWTNPHPAPHATHRPRVRQPARPHRPTSPPTTQGPLEAWCFPRPAAAGHSGTRHSVRVPFQAHRCSSPIVAWLELMLDIAQIRKQCTTVLSRNTGHVGST